MVSFILLKTKCRANIKLDVKRGLKEGAEATHNSLEDFLRVEFFEKHMQLQNIEVMRAHRTNVNQRATEANTSTVTLTKPGDMGHIWSKYGNGMV